MQRRKPTLHENLPIIEVRDKVTLDMLFADAQASRFLIRRLSEKAAIVMPGQFDALYAQLRKLGHTPKVSEK
ncbi:MAG: hypothetical protein O7E52_29915 [Candidatus Poribacteria bacterium]|nr:hypothetical protein [Candidatus Poribacteria bacterium]